LLTKIVKNITSNVDTVKKSVIFLDAPSHLFSSTKVAKTHPTLLESVVVLNFHSHLPGELSRTWPHYQRVLLAQGSDKTILTESDADAVGTAGAHTTKNILLRVILAVGVAVVLWMQWVGSLSFTMQRIVIRLMQPIITSGLSLLWLFATSSIPAFAATGAGTVAVALAILWRQHHMDVLERKSATKVVPACDGDIQGEEEDSDGGGLHRQVEAALTLAPSVRHAPLGKDNHLPGTLPFESAEADWHGQEPSSPCGSMSVGEGSGPEQPLHLPAEKQARKERTLPASQGRATAASVSSNSSQSAELDLEGLYDDTDEGEQDEQTTSSASRQGVHGEGEHTGALENRAARTAAHPNHVTGCGTLSKLSDTSQSISDLDLAGPYDDLEEGQLLEIAWSPGQPTQIATVAKPVQQSTTAGLDPLVPAAASRATTVIPTTGSSSEHVVKKQARRSVAHRNNRTEEIRIGVDDDSSVSASASSSSSSSCDDISDLSDEEGINAAVMTRAATNAY
jgi:hypothetical protein